MVVITQNVGSNHCCRVVSLLVAAHVTLGANPKVRPSENVIEKPMVGLIRSALDEPPHELLVQRWVGSPRVVEDMGNRRHSANEGRGGQRRRRRFDHRSDDVKPGDVPREENVDLVINAKLLINVVVQANDRIVGREHPAQVERIELDVVPDHESPNTDHRCQPDHDRHRSGTAQCFHVAPQDSAQARLVPRKATGVFRWLTQQVLRCGDHGHRHDEAGQHRKAGEEPELLDHGAS